MKIHKKGKGSAKYIYTTIIFTMQSYRKESGWNRLKKE